MLGDFVIQKKNRVVLIYNLFMFLSQYWRLTLWSGIYAHQKGSPPVWISYVKNILYLWSQCQSLTVLRSAHRTNTPGSRKSFKKKLYSQREQVYETRPTKIKKYIFVDSNMLGSYKTLRFGAAVILAALAVVRSSPVVGPEPIRCSPCTPQKLNDCPAVPSDCKQVLREPGCGCCMACALEKGASCGVHTAHCGEGLHCVPRPGEARPLHALTRGQGICSEDLGQGSFSDSLIYLYQIFSFLLGF